MNPFPLIKHRYTLVHLRPSFWDCCDTKKLRTKPQRALFAITWNSKDLLIEMTFSRTNSIPELIVETTHLWRCAVDRCVCLFIVCLKRFFHCMIKRSKRGCSRVISYLNHNACKFVYSLVYQRMNKTKFEKKIIFFYFFRYMPFLKEYLRSLFRQLSWECIEFSSPQEKCRFCQVNAARDDQLFQTFLIDGYQIQQDCL